VLSFHLRGGELGNWYWGDHKARLGRLVKPFGDPKFDERLARHAEVLCLSIESFDHPYREIDIDALCGGIGAATFRPVNGRTDIFSRIKPIIEITRFHNIRSPVFWRGAPR
jgi:hypothetical protein